jgi:hypothetical protein
MRYALYIYIFINNNINFLLYFIQYFKKYFKLFKEIMSIIIVSFLTAIIRCFHDLITLLKLFLQETA